MSTAEDYQAKAAAALAQLSEATSDAQRLQLRRAYSAYMKLSTHGAEAAARAAMKPAPKPVAKNLPKEQSQRLGAFTPK